jgi:hypothetical protein
VTPVRDPALECLLDPYRDPVLTLRLRCGTCDRVFGTVSPNLQWHSVLSVERFTTRKSGRQGSVAPRPYMPVPEKVDGREWVEGGALRFPCHRKCNKGHPRRWVTDNSQLVRAFARAAQAGRRELVFGENC